MTDKELINELKKIHQRTIKDRFERYDTFFNFFIGKEHIKDYCFASLFRILRERHLSQLYATRMLLYFNRNETIFDYNTIFNELNIVFGGMFTITRYYSGSRTQRIIDIKSDEKAHNILRWMGLYLMASIIRTMDMKFYSQWREAINDKRITRIENLRQLLAVGHNKISWIKSLCVNNIMSNSPQDSDYYDTFLSNMQSIFGVDGIYSTVTNRDCSTAQSSFRGWYQQRITNYLFELLDRKQHE
jgi:hypothetical protein